ncbi:MAG: sensor histidine kinase [Streptosporangiaceae bacterium]
MDATLAWAFLGVRGFVLVQVAVAVSAGSLASSGDAPLEVALLGLVAAESLLLGRWLAGRRSLAPFAWPTGADMALALVALASVPAYIAPDARINTWTMWAYPVTLSTALLVGAALRRLAAVLAVSGMMAACYLAVTAVPLFSHVIWRATAVVNSLAFPGFAVLTYFLCRFVRDLASAADSARARVAELEQDRSRALVHDLLVYLRLDRFAEADDKTRQLMITQAQAKHAQLRSWVDGSASAGSLAERIGTVLRLHPGLALDASVEVSHDDPPDEIMEQLERALDTVLSNVEQHAPGARVALTARSSGDLVTVTVHDDGPGFDPAAIQPGFGVGHVLARQLAGVGGSGVVESRPGSGTCVTITVPRRPP